MKKTITLIVSAAFLCAACQKVEPVATPDVESSNASLVIVASEPDSWTQTKTQFEKDQDIYHSYWTNGDMIKVFIGSDYSHANTQYTFVNNAESGQAARFELKTGSDAPQAGTFKMIGFHRNGRFLSHLNYEGSGYQDNATAVCVEMQEIQHPSVAGPDASQDFLIMKPAEFTYSSEADADNTVDAQFARVSSVIRITFADKTTTLSGKLAGNALDSLRIESSDAYLSGHAVLDLSENGGFKEGILENLPGKTIKHSKAIRAFYTDKRVDLIGGEVFLNTVPQVIEGGKLTITATAGCCKIYKEIDLSGKSVAFKPGKITSLNISLTDDNVICSLFAGEGSAASPYQIADYADLVAFAGAVNGGLKTESFVNGVKTVGSEYRNKPFSLVADIDASESSVTPFTPIAKVTSADAATFASKPYNSIFDGCGHSISNLQIADMVYGGLFGNIARSANASILNLVLDNVSFAGYTQNNQGFLVGIIGHPAIGASGNAATATVKNVVVRNSSMESENGKRNDASAMISNIFSSASIENCVVSNTVVEGNARVGGIVGGVKGVKPVSIKSCVIGSGCEIRGYNSSVGGVLGGILAVAANVTIDACSVYAKKVSTANAMAGGIVGSATHVTSNVGGSLVVSNCTCSGTTLGCTNATSANRYIGGIVGRGGFITATTGYNGLATSILNCCASNLVFECTNVTDNNLSVGGLCGGAYSNQTYDICYTHSLTFNLGAGEKAIGTGLVSRYNTGLFNNSITNCFSDTILSIYAQGTFSADGNNCGSDTNEVIEDMTSQAFIAKLEAARTSYSGGKATLSGWSVGADGYPTIAVAISDPDAK